MLLNVFVRLPRKLDLTFLLLLAVVATPACIIPVGPDWRDPFGTPNAPPQILDPDPELGDTVTVTTNPKTFRIFVTDVNGQKLWINWFVDKIDRPHNTPFVEQNGTPLRTLSEKTVTCVDIPLEKRGLPTHAVEAVVADEEFEDNNRFLVKNGGLKDEVFWTLIMTCQQ